MKAIYIAFIALGICVYDLCGLLAVLLLNRKNEISECGGADNLVLLVFWPLVLLCFCYAEVCSLYGRLIDASKKHKTR